MAQKRLRSLELAHVDRGAARTDEIAFAVSQRDRVDREIHGAAVAMEKGTIHVQRRASLHQLEEFIVERLCRGGGRKMCERKADDFLGSITKRCFERRAVDVRTTASRIGGPYDVARRLHQRSKMSLVRCHVLLRSVPVRKLIAQGRVGAFERQFAQRRLVLHRFGRGTLF